MESAVNDDWNVGEKSELVSIGSHKLFLSVSGPDRTPGEPVVLLVVGVTCTLSEWPVAIRMISSFARIVSYDRSGFGQSEKSANSPSPTTIVAELRSLLQAKGIQPPYITLGHSWGGILTSEFMAASPNDVAGMIFADASAPDPAGKDNTPWKNPVVKAVNGNLDYADVTGITKSTVLSPEEWKAFMDEEASEKHGQQATLEMEEVDGSYAPLVAKGLFNMQPPILGKRPVCVLKAHSETDFKALYVAGVKAGNGTEEERAVYHKMLDTWEEREIASQRQYLGFSEKNHYMETKWCGHYLQLMEPETIVEALNWTLQNLAT